MINQKQQLGAYGEQYVCDWLEKNDVTVLARNYRTRNGEIDIIAHKGEVVAFIEVKTRNTHYFSLSTVITPAKQRSVVQAAKYYIAGMQNKEFVFRFDVALLERTQSGYEIEYYSDAFRSQEW